MPPAQAAVCVTDAVRAGSGHRHTGAVPAARGAKGTMKADVTSAKLNEIAGKVWSMVLGLKLTPARGEPTRAAERSFVLGKVTISGNWQGLVTLGCSPNLARRAAAAMFGKPEAEADAGEIRDALGELTNMVGGNFKSLLKGDCRLSLPNVLDAVPYAEVCPAGAEHSWFECDGEPVILHVLEQGGAR
jgi:chemotaxis protein CheX